MTLNLTVLTAATIYQSADFRMTDGRTGKPGPDPSDKMVTISYASWSGFVTYTGVGLDLDGRPVSRLLAEWLTGPEDRSEPEGEALMQRSSLPGMARTTRDELRAAQPGDVGRLPRGLPWTWARADPRHRDLQRRLTLRSPVGSQNTLIRGIPRDVVTGHT